SHSRGDSHPSLGIVLGNHGSLLSELGRYEQAEAAHRRALDVHRKNFGERHARVALALNALGRSLSLQKRPEEAARAYREALAALPESHAAWAPLFHRNLGAAYLDLGDASGALAEFARAQARIEADGQGGDSVSRAKLRRWQAAAQLAAGNAEQASRLSSESIALFAGAGRQEVELA